MAKNSRPRASLPENSYYASDLTKQAVNVSEVPMVHYANHIQLNMNDNEIFIDFFRFEPSSKNDGTVVSVLTQRVIIPVGLGKGLANAVANLIAGYEKMSGKPLPNQRAPQPDDVMDIWK